MGISQACIFVVQFSSSAIVARLLSPREMGVFVLALSISGILAIVQGLGLSGLIVREARLSESLKQTIFTINLLINGGVSLAIVLIGLAGGWLFPASRVDQVLLVLALVPLLGCAEFLPAAMTERAANFRAIALLSLGRSVIASGATLEFAYSGFSSISCAYGQVSGALFGALAYNIIGRAEVRWRPRFDDWRRVAAFGSQMLTINGLNTAASRIAEVVLARLAGLEALALFARASGINNLAWENLHFVAARVLFVRLAALQRTGDSLRHYYLYVVEVLTALLWPAFAGLAVVSGPFIQIVYGPSWAAAARPLVFLALASAVWASLTLSWELFVVCGETRRQTRIELARTLVGTGLFASGAALGGLTGAAVGRLVDAVFAAVVYRRPIEGMSHTTLRDVWPIYRRSLYLTVIAVAPAGALAVYHHGAVTPPLELLAAISLGVAAWALVLYSTNHPLAQEAERLLRRMTGHAAPPVPEGHSVPAEAAQALAERLESPRHDGL